MPQIRPITDLRNTNEISKQCHNSNEPIFITKNGYDDLVIMSNETYNTMNKIKDFLLIVSNIIFSVIYAGTIMLFLIIGFVLDVKFGWWWASLIFATLSYLLLEIYGRNYFKFNKKGFYRCRS